MLDEYGCFVGIVTLHDLVETLVGDIDDRTDLPKQMILRRQENISGKYREERSWMMWQRS